MERERLIKALGGPGYLRRFDEIDSTNTYAKAWAREGAPHGALVLADRQAAGRGRMGRSFFSPEGGLYMSLILDSGGFSPGQLTTLAAVAVREAVLALAEESLQIKWVNDLLLHGKKVCGILAEGIFQQEGIQRCVIGIGINLGPLDLPESLRPIAGTLYQEGRALDRHELCLSIISRIKEGLPQVPAHMDRYRAHCVTLGKRVSFAYQGREAQGIARRVDDEGALMVETDEGMIRLIAGEVSARADR